MHLPFCAHFIFSFLFLTGVELRHFSIRNAEGVPSLCNRIYLLQRRITKMVSAAGTRLLQIQVSIQPRQGREDAVSRSQQLTL